jgi:Ser/Thr protein kinase RdoA (MazF antagonist)
LSQPEISLQTINQMILQTGWRVSEFSRFPKGEKNENYLLHVETGDKIVLRILKSQDVALKEEYLLAKMSGKIPVPTLLYRDFSGQVYDRPFYLQSYIGGVSFRDLAKSQSTETLSNLLPEIGKILAAIGIMDIENHAPENYFDIMYRSIRTDRFKDRMGLTIVEEIERTLEINFESLKRLVEMKRVVHCDFKGDNILIDPTTQKFVVGIIDWEFAMANCPIYELSGFKKHLSALRPQDGGVLFESFIAGYSSVAKLPTTWEDSAALLDLVMACYRIANAQHFNEPNRDGDFIKSVIEHMKFTLLKFN